jgi:PIN domain nuclease of toxin-antitoxin system
MQDLVHHALPRRASSCLRKSAVFSCVSGNRVNATFLLFEHGKVPQGFATLTAIVERRPEKGDNDLYFSCASVWEMSIKIRTKKLTLLGSDLLFVSDRLERNSIAPLPVFLHHAVGVQRLPLLHRDPFDRMLIAQAMAEDMPIISADEQIAQYDLKVIW